MYKLIKISKVEVKKPKGNIYKNKILMKCKNYKKKQTNINKKDKCT